MPLLRRFWIGSRLCFHAGTRARLGFGRLKPSCSMARMCIKSAFSHKPDTTVRHLRCACRSSLVNFVQGNPLSSTGSVAWINRMRWRASQSLKLCGVVAFVFASPRKNHNFCRRDLFLFASKVWCTWTPLLSNCSKRRRPRHVSLDREKMSAIVVEPFHHTQKL